MPHAAELLDRVRHVQKRGDLPQAERLCRQFLGSEPDHVEGWQLLGTFLQAQNKVSEAVAAYQQVVRLRPDSVEGHFQLARGLLAQGQREAGLGHYRQTVRLRPDHADALNALGVALAEKGDLVEALSHLRQAVRVRPEQAQFHHNLGVALMQCGQAQEAVASLRQALVLAPEYAEACYNLAAVLVEGGQREEAIPLYRRAIELRPSYGEAYNNLGLALTEVGRHAEAVVVLNQAVRLRPQAAESHNNLGLALAALGRFDEAEACYREALRLQSGYVEGHNNLGSVYKEQGRLTEALACYQVALWHDPHSASTRYNRSLALLANGNWEEGWREYEWRWQRKRTPARPFQQPRWDGSLLEGRTILLWSEQGLGDTIQFARFAEGVKERGGRVVLECPGCLVPLFCSLSGVDELVAERQPLPAFDVQVPLMSLPGLFGTTVDNLLARVPYLHAEPERVERWRQRLAELDGLKVGVVWQGNPRFEWDRWRSFPLPCLTPLAEVEGVRLVNLQKGPGSEQVAGLKGQFRVTGLGEELDRDGAFVDTAAVMKGLDLVVSADTSAAHLAGALGVPVWLGLSRVCDWRWLREREETPWYPSMRLFRQEKLGDWAGVFERMAGELQKRVGQMRRRTVAMEVAPGELLDRLTILQIKSERITDPGKREWARLELGRLGRAREAEVVESRELERLTADLKAVNEALWQAEDGLRRLERAGEFGEDFVRLARSVYLRNDERARIKEEINRLLGAEPGEPKECGHSG